MTFKGPFELHILQFSTGCLGSPGWLGQVGWMSVGLPLTCPKPSSSIQANSLLKLWVLGFPASAPAALFFLSNSLLSSPGGQQALCQEGNRGVESCPTGPLVTWIPVCINHQVQRAQAV